MNTKILGHPLNWVIVTALVVVGAIFWFHVAAGVNAMKAQTGCKGSGVRAAPDQSGIYGTPGDSVTYVSQ